MRKKILVLVVVALGIILGLFLGCKNDMIEELEKVQAHVVISVRLPDEMVSAYNVDPDSFEFNLKWYPSDDKTKGGEEDFSYQENIGIVYKFDPGEYTFEIIAKDKNKDEVKASGRASSSILPGQREHLEIPLTYYLFGDDSGFTMEDGILTLSGNLTFTDNQTITIPSDMKLVIEDGCVIEVGVGNKLTIDGVVETEGDLTVKGNLEITDEFTVAGDLTLTEDTTLTIPAGKELNIGGAIVAEDDLAVEGEGKLHTEKDLTVEGDFTADSGVTVVVDGTLDVEKTTNIKGMVSTGSLPTEEGKTELTITIAPGGSLEVSAIDPEYKAVEVTGGGTFKINSDTALDEVTLSDGSKLEIVGTLQNEEIEISGDGALVASSIVGDKLTNSGNLTITTDSTTVDELELKDNTTLTLEGDVATGLISGNGKLAVDSIVGGVDGTLTISGKPTVDGDLLLESGITLSFDDDKSTLEVTGSVEAAGDLTISGDGKLKVTEDLKVAGSLSATDDQLDVSGDISENTLLYGAKPNLVVHIEAGDTLKLAEIGDGWETVSVTGGGTLEVETVTVELDKIQLEDDSILKVEGALQSTGELEISGTGTVTAGSIEVDKLTSVGNQTITADTFDIREIESEANKTLTLKGDVTIEVVSGTGSQIVEGEVTLEELSIESGAILEASSLVVAGDTLTITDGGTLKVNNDVASDKIIFKDNSGLEVVGEVVSETISGEGTISADPIIADEIVLEDGKTLTFTGDVTTEVISGDGTLVASGDVEGVGGNLTVTGSPTVDGDLHLGGETTITFTAGSTLEVTGSIEADGNLTLSGSGALEVTGNLAVEDSFTTSVDVNVGDTLVAGNDIDIGGDVSVGSLTMDSPSTLTIKKDSSLEIEKDGTTTLDKVVLVEGSSKLELKGDLESGEISGAGTLEANSVTTEKISNTDDLTITADSITANVIELEDNNTLILEGDVTTGLISGDGKLAVDGIVGGEDGTLTISGKPTVDGDLSLESGITLSFDDNSTLKVTGSVETEGDLAILGDGKLEVAGNLNVAGNLDATEDQFDVDGDVNENTSLYGVKPNLVAHIEAGNTRKLDEIGDGWETVTVTGGGTLEVEAVTVKLDEITLEDGSALKIDGDLQSETISGEGTISADSIATDEIVLEEDNILTLTGDVTTEVISGDGTLAVEGVVRGVGKELTIEDTPIIDGDLYLEAGTTITFTADSTLDIEGNLKAEGDLTLSGNGTLEVTGNLTVEDNFTTSVDMNVEDTLTANGDVVIDSDVTVGSMTMDDTSTLTIKEDGSLVIKDDGTTSLNEIVFEDKSKLEVAGKLESETISGKGSLEAVSIEVTEITLEDGDTLELKGAVIVEKVTGSGTAAIEGTVIVENLAIADTATLEAAGLIVEGGALSVSDGGTLKVETVTAELDEITLEDGSVLEVEGELTLSDGASLTFSDDATLTIKDNVVALGDLTLSGEGTLSVNEDFNVTGKLTVGNNVIININGETSVGSLSSVAGQDIEINIETGTTLKVTSLDEGDKTVTVSSGGTLKIVDNTALNEIMLEDGSTLEIEGTLRSKDEDEIEITGSGSVKVASEVEATDLSIGSGVTLDISEGSLKATGDVTLAGTLELGATEWDSVTFGAQGNIILVDDSADLKLNGTSIKWYTLDGAKAKYLKVDGDVQLAFVEGSGTHKATPAGTDKTPTEAVTRVASGVTFEIPDNKNDFYLKIDDELVIEDGGTLDIGKYWFSNFNSGLFEGSIIVKSDGNLSMNNEGNTSSQRAVGPENANNWHLWAWKQDGTKTVITSDGNWTFKAETDGGNNTIDISHSGVVTPIVIDEGVTATISGTLVQQSSTFTNRGTVEVTGTFDIKENNGLVFGTKDAGLIVKPSGTLKYSSNAWLGTAGVGRNGFVRIEGGSFVTLGGVLWFGPTPSNPSSYLNLESNVIVEIGDGLLTAYKKDESSNEGNVLSAKYIGTNLATPNLDILVEKGVNFNIKDKFGSIGNLEIEEGASFTVEGSYAVGVRTFEKKEGATTWTAIVPTPTTDKRLTIKSGASFEIKSGGKIETVGNGQIRNGTIDINPGATVKLGGSVVDSPVKTSFTNYVSDHTVKYGEDTWVY